MSDDVAHPSDLDPSTPVDATAGDLKESTEIVDNPEYTEAEAAAAHDAAQVDELAGQPASVGDIEAARDAAPAQGSDTPAESPSEPSDPEGTPEDTPEDGDSDSEPQAGQPAAPGDVAAARTAQPAQP